MQKIRNEMTKLVRSGFDKEQISRRLKDQFSETKESVIDKIVNEKNDSEFRLAQKIMRSNLFTNMEERGTMVYLNDPFHPEIKRIEKAQLRQILDKDAYKFLEIRPCELSMTLLRKKEFMRVMIL